MFYFDKFFYDFKKEIYKNRNRKMNIVDILLLTITIVLGLAALILFELKSFKIINTGVSILVVFLLIFSEVFYVILMIKISKENKKIDFLKLHKENVTDKIIVLLKNKQYEFYNIEKVNWLISCCNKKLNEKNDFNKCLSVLKTLGSWFLPLLTLAIGIVVQKFSNEELIYYIAMIIIGFFILFLFLIMLIPVIDYFNSPNKKCLECLLGELEFIKTNISNI
ncbi:MAG: hypothetical protein J1E36_02175 [Eubacterium sp.]|nr:hypothetical protein [Eubacterium sp.]